MKNLTLLQRLSGFVYTITLFFRYSTWPLFSPCRSFLYPEADLSHIATNYQLKWLLRLCFIALAANRVNEFMMYLPAGYRLGRRDSGAIMWMAPCKLTVFIGNQRANGYPRSCLDSDQIVHSSQVARRQGCCIQSDR